ncbi:unnamed protein product [Caenorhabditis nigoni]
MSSIIEMPELVLDNIIGFSDFKAVLTLRQVCRDFRNFIDNLNDSKWPDSKFKQIKVYAKKTDNTINIETYNQSQIKSLLQSVDPDSLWELNLTTPRNMKFDVNEIVKTEQWKRMRRFDCETLLLNLRVKNICHFSSCFLKMKSITASDLDFLKKTYISSSNFEISFFNLKSFNEKEEISNLWGPAFTSGTASHWYFRMKDSEEKILHIEIHEDNDIQFETTDMRFVLNDAIIHDYKKNLIR